MYYRLLLLCHLICCGPVLAKKIAFNIMAPLEVGNIHKPYDASSETAWREFEEGLRQVKAAGVHAVTTDIWWGVVAVTSDPNHFDWQYYDRLVKVLERVGLKWVPILSFHRCGGNVGDECDIDLPNWIGSKYVGQEGIASLDDLGYASEYGNKTLEAVSVWASSLALEDYRIFMNAFQEHFAEKSDLIDEINISLGPSGELRYPSYGAHDGALAAYPTRGALQSYSELAQRRFQEFAAERYGSLGALNLSWGTQFTRWEQVRSPTDVEQFFFRKDHFSAYGKDYFEWYQTSLIQHGYKILDTAVKVFSAAGSAFHGIAIGAKIPGIHWRMASDRLAELTSGMISTKDHAKWSLRNGLGYRRILKLFSSFRKHPLSPKITLHFTCLEKGNGDGGSRAQSRAQDLVMGVSKESKRQKISIRGENALAESLDEPEAWDLMREALTRASYEGLTLLRLQAIFKTPGALSQLTSLATEFSKE